ncbi:MAG TPA: hypothetical protein VFB38_18865 [Chthonomonadaceae bacterium]|nr:hypothetical protein [Chthonomonadaceae bacterium]
MTSKTAREKNTGLPAQQRAINARQLAWQILFLCAVIVVARWLHTRHQQPERLTEARLPAEGLRYIHNGEMYWQNNALNTFTIYAWPVTGGKQREVVRESLRLPHIAFGGPYNLTFTDTDIVYELVPRQQIPSYGGTSMASRIVYLGTFRLAEGKPPSHSGIPEKRVVVPPFRRDYPSVIIPGSTCVVCLCAAVPHRRLPAFPQRVCNRESSGSMCTGSRLARMRECK